MSKRVMRAPRYPGTYTPTLRMPTPEIEHKKPQFQYKLYQSHLTSFLARSEVLSSFKFVQQMTYAAVLSYHESGSVSAMGCAVLTKATGLPGSGREGFGTLSFSSSPAIKKMKETRGSREGGKKGGEEGRTALGEEGGR
eukprot:2558340-Rhodomonas_salina.3